MTPPRLWLIDGNSQVYRAFHALPPLTAPDGTPTQAVLGFANMLLKVLREEAPSYLVVAFDPPGETERHLAFAAYKSQRPAMPSDLEIQLPTIRRVLDALRVRWLAVPGVEADDLIGSLARLAAEAGLEVVIQSGDKDFLQLVGPRVWVSDPARGWVGEAEVRSRYGVGPGSLVDVLALMGDPVDNIPGVPGVGRKRAAALVGQFGNVEGLLNGLEAVPRPALRERLRQHANQIRLNRSLITIRTDLPAGRGLDDLRRQDPDREALRALFGELGFSGLLKRLPELGPKPIGVQMARGEDRRCCGWG